MNSLYYVQMCSLCEKRQASHSSAAGRITLDLCCECWIDQGNPPADWHLKCMAAWKRRALLPGAPPPDSWDNGHD